MVRCNPITYICWNWKFVTLWPPSAKYLSHLLYTYCTTGYVVGASTDLSDVMCSHSHFIAEERKSQGDVWTPSVPEIWNCGLEPTLGSYGGRQEPPSWKPWLTLDVCFVYLHFSHYEPVSTIWKWISTHLLLPTKVSVDKCFSRKCAPRHLC